MWNVVFVVLCGPALSLSLDLSDLPRSPVVEEIAKCRVACVDAFVAADMENRLHQSWDDACQSNRDCRMCWSFCAMLEHGAMPDNAVCYDAFYCFKGCKVACQFQEAKNQNEEIVTKEVSYTSLPSLPYILQEGSTVHWAPPSPGILVYTVFAKRDGEWTYFDQVSEESIELPMTNGALEVAVLASNQSSEVAMASLHFKSPPAPVSEAEMMPRIPIRKVKGRMRGPIRPRMRVKGSAEEEYYLSVEDLKRLLEIQEENEKSRPSRDFFSWDLRVTEMRMLQDGLVEMEIRWNRYPASGGVYRVEVSSVPDFFQKDNVAVIVVPKQHDLNIQVEYRNHRTISRSPKLKMDLLPAEPVEEDSTNNDMVILIIAAVAMFFLLMLLVLAVALICWTTSLRKSRKLSTSEANPGTLPPPTTRIEERHHKFTVQLSPLEKNNAFKFPSNGSPS